MLKPFCHRTAAACLSSRAELRRKEEVREIGHSRPNCYPRALPNNEPVGIHVGKPPFFVVGPMTGYQVLWFLPMPIHDDDKLKTDAELVAGA